MRKLSAVCALLFLFLWGGNMMAQVSPGRQCPDCARPDLYVSFLGSDIQNHVTNVSCYSGRDGKLVFDQSLVCQNGDCFGPFTYYLYDPNQQIAIIEGGTQEDIVFENLPASEYTLIVRNAAGQCSYCYRFVVQEPVPFKNHFETHEGLRAVYPPTCHNGTDGRVMFGWDLRRNRPVPVNVGEDKGTGFGLRSEPVQVVTAGPDEIYFSNPQNTISPIRRNLMPGEQVEFNNLPAGTYNLLYRTKHVLRDRTRLAQNLPEFYTVECESLFVYVVENPAPITFTLSAQDQTCGTNGGLRIVDVKGGLVTEDIPYYDLAGNIIGTSRYFRGKQVGVYTREPVGVEESLWGRTTLGQFLTQRTPIYQGTTIVGYENKTSASSYEGTQRYNGQVTTIPELIQLDQFSEGDYWLLVSEIDAAGNVSNGCRVKQQFRVNRNTSLDFTFSTTRPSCHSGNDGMKTDGEIAINIVRGVPPYRIDWEDVSDGSDDIPSDQTFAVRRGLRAGAYNVTIKDDNGNGCMVTKRIVVEEPEEILINLQKIDVLCDATSGGQATATVTGGARPYTSWTWSAGQEVILSNTMRRANNLLAGNYNLRVSDSKGCSERVDFEIRQEERSPIRFRSIETRGVSCFGNTDGEVTFSMIDGTRITQFILLNPQRDTVRRQAPSPLGETTIQGLAAGRYTVIAFDGSIPAGRTACFTSAEFEISTPDKIVLSNPRFTMVRCKGESTGAAHFQVNGGTVGNVFPFQKVPMGTVDSPNYEYELLDYPNLVPVPDARISFEKVDGVGTMLHVEGLRASWYVIRAIQRVPDRRNPTARINCLSDTIRFQVVEPTSGLVVRVKELQGILCNTENNRGEDKQGFEGRLEADIMDYAFDGRESGTPPYRYTWSLKPTDTPNTRNWEGKIYDNLPAGTYTVNVIDAQNCTATATYTLTQPDYIKINNELTSATAPVSCRPDDYGSINLVWNGRSGIPFSGGTVTRAEDYTVTFSPVPPEYIAGEIITISGGSVIRARITSLPPGEYTVKVRDARGCFDTKQIVVNPPLGSPTGIRTDVVQPCQNQDNGFLRVVPIGGSSPYVATIRRQDNNQPSVSPSFPQLYDYTNLFSDVYYLNIRDAAGCQYNKEVRLNKLAPVTAQVDVKNVSCFNGTDGGVTATISGGFRPYHLSYDRIEPYDSLITLDANWNGHEVTIPNYMEQSGTGNTITVHLSGDKVEFRNRTAGNVYFTIIDSRMSERDDVIHGGLNLPERNACQYVVEADIKQPQQLAYNALEMPYNSKLDLSCHDTNDGVIYIQPGYRQNGLVNDNITTRTLNPGRIAFENITVIRNGATLDPSEYVINDMLGPDVPVTDMNNPNFIKSGFITRVQSASAPWVVNTTPGSFQYRDREFIITNTIDRNFDIPCPSAGLSRFDIIVARVDNFNQPGESVFLQQVPGVPGTNPVPPTPGANEVVLATIYVTSNCERPGVMIHPVYETYRITGLTDGNYTIVSRNANGCEISQNVTINRPSELMASVTTKDSDFCGQPRGEVTVSVTGGTAPFRYRLFEVVGENATQVQDMASAQRSVTFNVKAGQYFVEVLPMNRMQLLETCVTRTGTVTVNNPTLPEFEYARHVRDVLCHDQENGIAEAKARGGFVRPGIPTPPTYSYVWYYLERRMVNDIEEEVERFTYEGARPMNLRAGTYRVYAVQLETNCRVGAEVVIGNPDPLTINERVERPVSCFNLSDAQISTSIAGGTAPYRVQWTVGNDRIVSPFGTPGNTVLNNIPAGDYRISVLDRNNCLATSRVLLENPDPIFTNVSNIVDATCQNEPGNTDGSLDVTVTGGTELYEVILESRSPNGTYTTVQQLDSEDDVINTFRGLPAGTYRVRVNDYRMQIINGEAVRVYQCNYISEDSYINTKSTIVTEVVDVKFIDPITGLPFPNAPRNSANISCSGVPTVVEAAVRANQMPLVFDWSNQGQAVPGMPSRRSFTRGGQYSVLVTDNLGCTNLQTFTITEDPFNPQIVVSNVTCTGNSDGSIRGTISGGRAPFRYSLNGGATVDVFGNSFVIGGLAPGNYNLQITDADNCTINRTGLQVREAAQAFAAEIIGTTDVSCNDVQDQDGTVTIRVSGGVAPYNYSFAGRQEVIVNQNQFTILNLNFGTTMVTVTDAYGCSRQLAVNIGRPQVNLVVTVRVERNQTTCRNADGEVSLLIDGGRPFQDGGPLYRVTWMSGNRVIAENTTVLSDLVAGTYSYRVEDANGCVRMRDVVVNGPSIPSIVSATVTPLVCKDGNNARIDITVTGGLMPYTYMWSNGATTQDLSNLTAGVYQGTVTDANGCQVVSDAITIANPEGIVIDNVATTPVSACGAMDGSLTIGNITPAERGPFSFSWRRHGDPTFVNPGTSSRTNLPAGTYHITITDNSGCITVVSATVGQPSSLAAGVSKRDISCNNENDGSISLTVSGGMQPYEFNWSNGSTESAIANLSEGTYYGTVTDAEGCFILVEEVITNPAVLSLASADVQHVSCNGASDAEIRIEIAGGTRPYRYNWSNGATSQNLIGIAAGDYTGTVTDANGCVFVSPTVTITQPAALSVNLEVQGAGCDVQNDGEIMANVAGGTAPYMFMWSNGDNEGSIMNLTPGDYMVTVTDANGCMVMATGKVELVQNQPRPTLTVTAGSLSHCVGSSVTIDAGVGYLGYLWSDGTLSEPGTSAISFRRDEPGTYTVFCTVETACGPLNSDTLIVNVNPVPAKPTVSYTQEDSLLVATVPGNPAGVTFQWQQIVEGEVVNLAGANSSTLKIEEDGQYQVVATIGTCSSTSDLGSYVLPVSRGGLKSVKALTLYPNPTNGSISLKGNWNAATVNVEVLNALGQVVLTVNEASANQGLVIIDLSSVASGVYQVRVRSSNSMWTGSVIKN